MNAIARHAPLLGVVASVAILATAYGFEHIGNLPPCALCYWQRYVYMAAIPLALIAGALDRAVRPRTAGLVLVAMAAVFLVGAGIAGYHTGVEQKWWAGPGGCMAPALSGTPEEVFRALMQAPVVRCDEVPWSLFGISMAGYNLLLSLALATLSLVGARQRLRRV